MLFMRTSRNSSSGKWNIEIMDVALGRVVITIFLGNAMATPPIFVFWDADSEFDIENFKLKK